MDFSLPDILIVSAYIVIILYIGFFVARNREKQDDDYILAGRKVTLPLFVGTLVATWYGNILGIGEFVYTSGIVAWICFGLPYYIAAAIFAFFIAGKIRSLDAKTIPEQIEMSYGKSAGRISSFIILIISIPAAYILMLGVMISLFTGWPLWMTIIIGTILALAYIFTGGLKADILTNSAQFVLMFIGFGVLLFFAHQNFGGVSLNINKLPDFYTTITGPYSWQYVLAWYIIAFQTFVDPTFHQRCAAAKSPKTAQRGILISICCWMVFDMLTLLTGLYARANLSVDSPLMAYPELADAVLPMIWKGLFVVAILASIMSTLDSYSLVSAITIGNDLLKPAVKNKISSKWLIRIGLVITGIFGIIMAIALPSAIDLIYKTASIAVPGLLMPLVVSFSKKYYFSAMSSKVIMFISSGTSAIWTAGQYFFADTFFAKTEPMLPGIIISLVLTFVMARKYDLANIKHT